MSAGPPVEARTAAAGAWMIVAGTVVTGQVTSVQMKVLVAVISSCWATSGAPETTTAELSRVSWSMTVAAASDPVSCA